MARAKARKNRGRKLDVNALHDYISNANNRKQNFGHYDCVRFVAECLLVGWNKDYLGALEYWDRRSAVRRLRKAGGLHKACCDLLGDPVSELKTGDVAYYEAPATVGIVMPTSVLVFMGNKVHRLDLESATHGWAT